MKLIGIPLRRPNSTEVTAAAVLATGLWLAALGALRLLHVPVDSHDAGALLVVAAWGALSAHVGIRVDRGQRHLLAQLAVSAALLALYSGLGQWIG